MSLKKFIHYQVLIIKILFASNSIAGGSLVSIVSAFIVLLLQWISVKYYVLDHFPQSSCIFISTCIYLVVIFLVSWVFASLVDILLGAGNLCIESNYEQLKKRWGYIDCVMMKLKILFVCFFSSSVILLLMMYKFDFNNYFGFFAVELAVFIISLSGCIAIKRRFDQIGLFKIHKIN